MVVRKKPATKVHNFILALTASHRPIDQIPKFYQLHGNYSLSC